MKRALKHRIIRYFAYYALRLVRIEEKLESNYQYNCMLISKKEMQSYLDQKGDAFKEELEQQNHADVVPLEGKGKPFKITLNDLRNLK